MSWGFRYKNWQPPKTRLVPYFFSEPRYLSFDYVNGKWQTRLDARDRKILAIAQQLKERE